MADNLGVGSVFSVSVEIGASPVSVVCIMV